MLIFLVGYMGCGKSTLGREMARRLGYEFVDTDNFIEEQQGKKISAIFAEEGENYFRKLEREAVKSLKGRDNVIVSTGGGLPCFNGNMELMNEMGFTVFIKLDPEMLVKRLSKTGSKRPLLAGKTPEELRAFIETNLGHREPFYSKAKMTVYGNYIQVDDILRLMELSGK